MKTKTVAPVRWFRMSMVEWRQRLFSHMTRQTSCPQVKLGLPTVPEWPGESWNWRLVSRVPGWVTFVQEVTDSSSS